MSWQTLRSLVVANAVLLLLALATVGVGYGLWSKALTIEGQVLTGQVDAKWKFPGCFEFYPWPDGGFIGEVEGKEVGEWSLGIDPADDQILHFTIRNGYPSYAVHCAVTFQVEGTIPVIIRGIAVEPGEGLTEEDCELSVTPDGSETLLSCPELTVIYIDGLGSQLHPGGKAESSLLVHVEQQADQNAVYGFDVKVCMAQWNEEATAEECFAAAQVH